MLEGVCGVEEDLRCMIKIYFYVYMKLSISKQQSKRERNKVRHQE